mmetsp:Transcript_14455/g.34609  ORF Transcript_14455/g.34609 Transcript_14455/m.34609 type:complete len:906 (+) Transcript_14455:77-2794(+)|eukprot:CAMPEP_0185817500 /NCGR_PEP_ID=MMETSP1322-20130828/19193_1 /TAXON_ID=265543 /ORGANISM="Minutocellus polymorphus, Strain RCC2270" /LENGTH=905 /DNA_ID=CAMNT_0028514549 /DNA_START=69 /DNA_END=2786 /DNA_ORIENTATION=-
MCRNNEESKEASSPARQPKYGHKNNRICGRRRCRHLAFVVSMTLLFSVPSYALQNTPIFSYSSATSKSLRPAAAKADLEHVHVGTDSSSEIKDSTDPSLLAAPFKSRLRNLTGRIRSLPRKIIPSRSRTADEPIATVRDVHELRREVLQNRVPLKDIGFNLTAHPVNATTVTAEQLANHDVMKVISQRVRTNSTPGNRAPEDVAHLALAIEGGGMRGAVSAGMAAAIASLGLSDAFDSVYGSSAGCIVGAYMISRQMAVSVYTEVLPAAGNMFASKNRVIGNVGVSYVSDLVSRLRERGSDSGGETKIGDLAANGTSIPSSFNLSGDMNDADGKSLSKQFRAGRLSRMAAKVPILNKAPSILSSLRPYVTLHPGMNLTFVIEGVMSSTSGLRPFDIDTFRKNDARQPLRVVSSTWRAGKMETVAFGSEDGDFWDVWVEGYEEEIAREGRLKRSAKAIKTLGTSAVNVFVRLGRKTKNLMRRFLGVMIDTEVGALLEDSDNELSPSRSRDSSKTLPGAKAMSSFRRPRAIRNKKRMVRLRQATASPDNSGKKGFFACLESSMLVPGAAGKPVKLLRSKHRAEVAESGLETMTSHCFDAFSYEPIPFRSAVENGATHVLALRSRPDGCFLETKPYTYEKLVAPVYFRLNGLPRVGEFFEKSGSQYRYVEDVLTLDEGLAVGVSNNASLPVKVPPTEIVFGTHYDEDIIVDPNAWKSAHLLPIICKANTPELPSLTQEKEEVVQAVREGFAAAFDMLSPVSPGLKFDPKSVDSRKIAELVFPVSDDDSEDILEKPVQVQGDIIALNEQERERRRRRFARWIARKRQERRQSNRRGRQNPFRTAVVEAERENPAMIGGKEDELDWLEAEALLAALPGFTNGKLNHLSSGLRSVKGQLISDTGTANESSD